MIIGVKDIHRTSMIKFAVFFTLSYISIFGETLPHYWVSPFYHAYNSQGWGFSPIYQSIQAKSDAKGDYTFATGIDTKLANNLQYTSPILHSQFATTLFNAKVGAKFQVMQRDN